MADLARVREVYQKYVAARNELLDALDLKRRSNRDPLAEFSEWLVAALVGGMLADNPVQKGWDVQMPNSGEKIQVKYLANSAEKWVNEHTIETNGLMNSYAIVIFEALLPKTVIIFPVNNLEAVGKTLHKKHPKLDKTLQFTQKNYRQILADAEGFKELGVRLFLEMGGVFREA